MTTVGAPDGPPELDAPSDPTVLAVSMNEGCRRLGVGLTTGYRLVRDGELPTIRVYSRRLIRVSDLEAFIEARAVAGTSHAASEI